MRGFMLDAYQVEEVEKWKEVEEVEVTEVIGWESGQVQPANSKCRRSTDHKEASLEHFLTCTTFLASTSSTFPLFHFFHFSTSVKSQRDQLAPALLFVDVERDDVAGLQARGEAAIVLDRSHGLAVDLEQHVIALEVGIERGAHRLHARHQD